MSTRNNLARIALSLLLILVEVPRSESGWTTILRRTSRGIGFDQNYDSYKTGFKDQRLNFWLGLDKIHDLTKDGDLRLVVNFRSWDDKRAQVVYRNFRVENDTAQYRLTVGGFESLLGDAEDELTFNNGALFYSDGKPDPHGCTERMRAGFWFSTSDKGCTNALPTGVYYEGGYYAKVHGAWNGIFWESERGRNYSLKSFDMAVGY